MLIKKSTKSIFNKISPGIIYFIHNLILKEKCSYSFALEICFNLILEKHSIVYECKGVQIGIGYYDFNKQLHFVRYINDFSFHLREETVSPLFHRQLFEWCLQKKQGKKFTLLTLSMAFPTRETVLWRSLCSVLSLETVSRTLRRHWDRTRDCVAVSSLSSGTKKIIQLTF